MNEVIHIDAISGAKDLDAKSVNCCITSPPYFGLRNYGTPPYDWPEVDYSILGFPVHVAPWSGELGQEPNHFQFIGHLVMIFREIHRVLRDDGTLWVNMGDSYAASGRGGGGGSLNEDDVGTKVSMANSRRAPVVGMKPKDLIGIPWMMAYALRDDGWYLRQDVIWAKATSDLSGNNGSVIPESVTDRFVKSHEYIFLLSKSQKYYFDINAIKKPIRDSSAARLAQNVQAHNGSSLVPGKTNGSMKAVKGKFQGTTDIQRRDYGRDGSKIVGHSGDIQDSDMANKRSVWHCNPARWSGNHFAVYPQELIIDMVKAGCPEGGVVLDPFAGRGTTHVVCRKNNRNCISFDLMPANIDLAERYIHQELGMFK